jgi:3-(3-hydroxy-phenyl)propionate hydroxylase
MRPAGRGQLQSLYFEYPHFDPPARRSDSKERHSVLIIGAGPVGLVAALALATYDIPCVVIEKNATFNDGSRAICLARHSFHILEQVGAVQPFVEKALGWTTGRSFYRGKQILEFTMPHDEHEKFLPMYNLQQQYTEKFLWQAASARPSIDIRWQSMAVKVQDSADCMVVNVRDPAGDYQVRSDWVLAADGAKSFVRSERGLRLAGENHRGSYLIADVRMHHDFPTIRRALFDPASRPGGTVLIHRQPDDIWRIDYQLLEGERAEEATQERVVRECIAAILAEIGHVGEWDLEWWSTYTADTLALEDYRDGRIFFVGDSAHIVPIFGVRGLNNGIADAANIAWKLAKLLKREAGGSLLDSYSLERRGATLDTFESALKSTHFMTPPSAGGRLVRDAVLSLAIDHEFVRAFANPRQVAPYRYRESPITVHDGNDIPGPASPGSVCPNARLSDSRFLSDLFGRGFNGICFAGSGAADLDVTLERSLRAVDPDFRLIRVGIGERATVNDARGELAGRLGIRSGGFLLVRPDRYVAAAWPKLDARVISHTLRRILSLGEQTRDVI